MPSRPNIVFIMADDLGFGDLSCYRPADASLAEARIPTRHLDGLTQQGIRVKEQPDRPFFLYWTPGAPHQPCVPLPQFRGASRAGLRGDKVVEMDSQIGEMPALLGQTQAAPLREATVHHSHEGTFAIRQGRWKLVDGHGGGDFTPHEPFNAMHYGAYRVFDLLEDPTESVNLCWQRPEIERRLHRLLDDYRARGRSRP